jgi:hypothetical protein
VELRKTVWAEDEEWTQNKRATPMSGPMERGRETPCLRFNVCRTAHSLLYFDRNWNLRRTGAGSAPTSHTIDRMIVQIVAEINRHFGVGVA